MLPVGIRVGSMASSNHHMHTVHPKGVMSIVGHYLSTPAGDTHTFPTTQGEKEPSSAVLLIHVAEWNSSRFPHRPEGK